VDVLVAMSVIAANSAQHELIFNPFPTIFDSKTKKHVLNSNRKDFKVLREILETFPTVQELTRASSFQILKQSMENRHPHSFSLLQWILTSNRSHIVKLSLEKHIKSMSTPHQYLLLSSPPEKEATFQNLKQKYGSVFAFHGSPMENWHAILREGLLVGSNNKYQRNGAVYGVGIYLSPQASFSLSYSTASSGSYSLVSQQKSQPTELFLNTKNIYCLALCEVINNSIKRATSSIWVQPDPSHVCTRFFFVYSSTTSLSCETSQPLFLEEVEIALRLCMSDFKKRKD